MNATTTPPLAIDLTSDGRPEIVALNASGVMAAFDGSGRTPEGWPLATGVGAAGSMVAADLDNDGVLEIVAPDRFNKFYAYAVPEPAGLKSASIEPEAAYYHPTLNEFVLPYEAVRAARSPDDTLAAFVRSTYDASAKLANWDRRLLDRPVHADSPGGA